MTECVLTDKKRFSQINVIQKIAAKLVADKFWIGRLRIVHFSSIVYEVIRTISSLFIIFFNERILNAQKHVTSKNQLTKQKQATLNNKGNTFLCAQKLL